MPEPRAAVFRAVTIEFDPVDWRSADYRRPLRRAEAYAGHAQRPARRPTRNGYPVHVRNGLPVKFYDVTDTLGCGCLRRLLPAVMDWELITSCGGHDA